MTGKPIFADYSPTVGSADVPPFSYFCLGRNFKIRNFRDYGGDDRFWYLWDEAFIADRPKGIIFMIDHIQIDKHKEAFRYLVEFISKPDRKWLFFKGKRTRARDQLKVILFLINKEDVWENSMRFEDFLPHFYEDFQRVDRLGIPFIMHSCSALTGRNVNPALEDFFMRMVGHFL